MKILMAAARLAAGAVVLAMIVWASWSAGYWYGGYYMPPLPTLTDNYSDPELLPGNSYEEGRITLDLLSIRQIIANNPDSKWAPIYANWIEEGKYELEAFKARRAAAQ
jgi:hypothetical protein